MTTTKNSVYNSEGQMLRDQIREELSPLIEEKKRMKEAQRQINNTINYKSNMMNLPKNELTQRLGLCYKEGKK